MTTNTPIKIGIIGGSGLGEALGAEAGAKHEVDTPFGKPSSPIVAASWEGVDIAILQRHGPGHVFNPSRVPYRANIYALKALGVTHIVPWGLDHVLFVLCLVLGQVERLAPVEAGPLNRLAPGSSPAALAREMIHKMGLDVRRQTLEVLLVDDNVRLLGGLRAAA